MLVAVDDEWAETVGSGHLFTIILFILYVEGNTVGRENFREPEIFALFAVELILRKYKLVSECQPPEYEISPPNCQLPNTSTPKMPTSQYVNSQNVNFPICQLPKCQLPKCQLPNMSTPKMSTPKMSTSQYVNSQNVNSQNVNFPICQLPKCQVFNF